MIHLLTANRIREENVWEIFSNSKSAVKVNLTLNLILVIKQAYTHKRSCKHQLKSSREPSSSGRGFVLLYLGLRGGLVSAPVYRDPYGCRRHGFPPGVFLKTEPVWGGKKNATQEMKNMFRNEQHFFNVWVVGCRPKASWVCHYTAQRCLHVSL